MGDQGVNRRTETSAWLWANKSWREANQETTHLLFSGGNFCVPEQETDNLLKHLAADHSYGLANYVVEQRTSVFRFCQDFDLFHPVDQLTLEEHLKPILREVASVLCDCYPDQNPADLYMIVCVSDPVWKEKDAKDRQSGETRRMRMLKSGYHVIWPELRVDQRTALLLRIIMIDHLNRTLPNHWRYGDLDYDDWETTLDDTIFKSNGLRLLYQNKAHPCKTCIAERRRRERLSASTVSKVADPDRINCGACRDTGYIDDGRPYKPLAVFQGDRDLTPDTSLLEALVLHPLTALRRTTIRCMGTSASATWSMTIPAWFKMTPRVDLLIARSIQTTTRARATKGRKRKRPRPLLDASDHHDVADDDDQELTIQFKGRLVPVKRFRRGHPTSSLVESFINDYVPHGEHPQTLRVLKVRIGGSAYSQFALAIGENHWCANVGREHNGSNVWYIISRSERSITQRCFSPKYGCSDYVSDPVHVPPAVLSVIFQDARSVDVRASQSIIQRNRALKVGRNDPNSVQIAALEELVQKLESGESLVRSTALRKKRKKKKRKE